MQSVSSRIWTRVAVSISYDDNHYTTGISDIELFCLSNSQIFSVILQRWCQTISCLFETFLSLVICCSLNKNRRVFWCMCTPHTIFTGFLKKNDFLRLLVMRVCDEVISNVCIVRLSENFVKRRSTDFLYREYPCPLMMQTCIELKKTK